MSRKIIVQESYKNKEYIIKEGSFGEVTYVILSGKVEISRIVNNKDVVLALLEKGDIFGEMSFIDQNPRSASAKAVGNVKVGVIDKDFLDNEINKTSQEFRTIIKAITERLRTTSFELVKLKGEYIKLKESGG